MYSNNLSAHQQMNECRKSDICVCHTHTHTHTHTMEYYLVIIWKNMDRLRGYLVKVAQLCPTLRDMMDYIVQGIL